VAEKIDQLSKNLKQSSSWYRIFSMLVLSLFVCLAVVPLIIVLAISQAVLTLLTGSNNQNLRYFGMEMADYVNQVLRYITYNSDREPYPFAAKSEKANLGASIKSRTGAQHALFKKTKSSQKKKLYEIDTSGDTGKEQAESVKAASDAAAEPGVAPVDHSSAAEELNIAITNNASANAKSRSDTGSQSKRRPEQKDSSDERRVRDEKTLSHQH